MVAPPRADDVGTRRARSRPPTAAGPTHMDVDGPMQEEYLGLVREELVLRARLARVQQQKRALQ
eukprot:12904325-Prorocentrum_lima.AAC.1